MHHLIKSISVATICLTCGGAAGAWEYSNGRTTFRIGGYATGGLIEPEFTANKFFTDGRLRAQMNYAVADGYSLGAVYAIDGLAASEGYAARDAFAFIESKSLGRIEVGLTDSIAKKMGLGLPDVGGLRLNDQTFIYREIHPRGPVIADTVINDGRHTPRINIATIPHHGTQFGLSLSAGDNHYDWAADTAIKVRLPRGKLKSALSLGTSFIDSPDNMRVGGAAQNLTADWRAQGALGLNLQYNSWIVGLNTRLIYDHNAIGRPSDGLAAGLGVSYDLLKYTLSASYMFSDTGIWGDGHSYRDHMALVSLRYKYSEDLDGWVSLGISTDTPFAAAGMRLTF